MVKARIFLYACLFFTVGVAVASFLEISLFLLFLFAACAAFLFIAGLAFRRHAVFLAAIFLAFFIFGFWRFDIIWGKTADNCFSGIISSGKQLEISGTVDADPVLKQNSQQITLRPDSFSGRILIVAGRYPEFNYGDRINFSAKLEAPRNLGDFDYKNYLAKDGIFAVARFSEINLVSKNNGNPVMESLFYVKHWLKKGINQSLPSPHDSILAAILLGDQSGLEGCSFEETQTDPGCAKLKEKLNISGLRHLAAVSGTHVTIMAQIIAPFFIWLGFWRQKALWLAILIVWAFIAMIGLPPSAVRAGIMGTLFIMAQIIGRPGDSFRIIVIAAALMVWQNPLVLRFDIGFQLSFLAVLGMVFFTRPIAMKLNFTPLKIEFVRRALAVALAAQIFTLPLLVYNFGYVSFYGLIANILVEPLVPFLTIYGFVLAFFSAASFFLGWLLFFPIWLALSYLLAVVDLFSRLPGAQVVFEINFFWLAAAYAFLALAAWRMQKKSELEFLN